MNKTREARVWVSCRIPDSLWKRLMKLKREMGQDTKNSEAVVAAIEKGLEALEP